MCVMRRVPSLKRDVTVAMREIALLDVVEQQPCRGETIGIRGIVPHIDLAVLGIEQQQHELFGDQHGFPPLATLPDSADRPRPGRPSPRLPALNR